MSEIVAHASTAATRPALVLASTSQYRRALLERLGVPFEAIAPHVDETPLRDERPEHTASRLARLKAAAVAHEREGALIIGSDQVATFDGRQIGKPGTHEVALEQLKAMRGRDVLFHTALALHDARDGRVRANTVTTRVRFRDLPEASLDRYLRLEQPYDCAGSAKSEGMGILLIERIEGDDPNALIGLPLIALTGMLIDAGYPILS